jgi:CheY-like chemotaxis protein
VLVIDDEPEVRAVVEGALRHLGYTVEAATDGTDGLRRYAEMAEPPRAVLLDMTMPGLSGDETLRRLRATNPTQRVVIMSGFSEQEAMQRCAELGVSEFMAKPFEIAALTEKFGAAR